MTIVMAYCVCKNLYNDPDTKHDIFMSTTEYICGNNVPTYLYIGKNLSIRLSNRLRYEFNISGAFANEQFMRKKAHGDSKTKPITRSTFEKRLKRFDIRQTAIETEIIEEYSYAGRDGSPDEVKIAIKMKDDAMSATIDFKDIQQFKNFSPPVWLISLKE
ncbi:MAG: hypothetical protein LBH95_02355 [Oscillospiraceae bacterium]|jgi:hypothetical protein|nr:hypothetical protein [Oscillospiraceae bacterium]